MQNIAFQNHCLIIPLLVQQQTRHRFTKEEDEAMLFFIEQNEDKSLINWTRVSSHMPNRTARQCRERYLNYLSEKTKKGNWTKEEDELILSLYEKYGGKWAKMASYFDKRSNIDIKNRYSALQRRKEYENIKQTNKKLENYNQDIKTENYCNQIGFISDNQYNGYLSTNRINDKEYM